MSYYLHAFCLDEDKAKPGHEEIVAGPFDWIGITWDYFRAGRHDDSGEDHQFIRHDSGFWYPLVRVPIGRMSESMQPDPTRGRYTDIYVTNEDQAVEILRHLPAGSNYGDVARPALPGEDLTGAWVTENHWLHDDEEPSDPDEYILPVQ
jgi:hypothetical protein